MTHRIKSKAGNLDPTKLAEPLLEWPDGAGGVYRLYTGVALKPGEHGEVQIFESKATPEPDQILLQESLRGFLRIGGKNWSKPKGK
jgi:hypothetical protein